jgi:hypothetical protein
VIIEQLEHDPDECWQALEGLESLELDVRLAIIEELSAHRQRPGVRTLLRLLSRAHDPATRAAAGVAIGEPGGGIALLLGPASSSPPATSPEDEAYRPLPRGAGDLFSEGAPAFVEHSSLHLARSFVGPVDGQGRGSIGISVRKGAQRRTAAFLCDVRRGIRDVVAEVKRESPHAGRLLDDVSVHPADDCAWDVPELALGILAGSLMLCGQEVPAAVRDWLDGTVGPGFLPAAFPATIPGLDAASIPRAEIPERARVLLDACPSWLDASPLTFELAEEICLREGQPAADPKRDAGAYRYLFEHRLIHRLELYRRMLLWMAWLWKCSGRTELARSALALAYQLSDEQYAVPSHPFMVALATRSLSAAQARLHSAADPRISRGGA